jgi:hypothetical protein
LSPRPHDLVPGAALTIFTNYFNQVAETDIDFPKLEPLPKPGN